MSFKTFSKTVIERFGAAVLTQEDGLMCAVLQDGTTLLSNGLSRKITVRWGSGHQAMAEL